MKEHEIQKREEDRKDETRRDETAALSRRGFLQGVGSAGMLAASGVGAGVSASLLAPSTAKAEVIGPITPNQRRARAFQVRKKAAQFNLDGPPSPPQPCNGDEALYPDLRASFFKTLPQNSLGEVDGAAYQQLIDALASGDPAQFASLTQSPSSARGLANPQAAYAFEMTGRDGHDTRIAAAPAFASALQAAEMGEVYWQAITRDVPFNAFGTDADVAAAVADLNASFSETVGPKVGGQVTPGTLFRGETPGDLIGPYISQLLWLPVKYGPLTFDQRYPTPVAGDDFMIDYTEWLEIQRGAAPLVGSTFDPTPRYIFNGRALGEFVHGDVTFQAYLNAALIMLGFGPAALADSNPYKGAATEGGFVTFGVAEIAHLVTKAANVGLKTAWYHKWLVHRRLRPEVFGGRIENQRNGSKDYGIHPDVLGSGAVSRLVSDNGNALLPMAFPEGSPTHPAYPAGHAANAGACATILKAFFKEDFVIPAPVEANGDGSALVPWTGASLTLGDEINKLANNVSLGRDTAGVHYRSDGIEGIEAGEQMAVGVLRDFSLTYNEDFSGFELTRFDGQKIRILDGDVTEI